MALHYEQQESNGIGAAVAQQVLSVTEPILLESSSQQRVIVRTISEEVHDFCIDVSLSLIHSTLPPSPSPPYPSLPPSHPIYIHTLLCTLYFKT